MTEIASEPTLPLWRSVLLGILTPKDRTGLIATTLPNGRVIETMRDDLQPSRYITYVFTDPSRVEFIHTVRHDSLSAAYEGHATMLRRWG